MTRLVLARQGSVTCEKISNLNVALAEDMVEQAVFITEELPQAPSCT